jgi:hypothetical protein
MGPHGCDRERKECFTMTSWKVDFSEMASDICHLSRYFNPTVPSSIVKSITRTLFQKVTYSPGQNL